MAKPTKYDREIAKSWLDRHYYPIFVDFHAEQSRFIRTARDWKGASVVEFGGKNGWHSEIVLDHGGERAVIVEGRQENIDQANPKHPDKMEYVCADARKALNLGAFDAALVFGLLYHLDYPTTFITRLDYFIKSDLLIWTHTTEYANTQMNGYEGALWNDSGTGNLAALEPCAAFWFTRDSLCRCLEDRDWRVKKCQQHKSPMHPEYDAYLIHCTR